MRIKNMTFAIAALCMAAAATAQENYSRLQLNFAPQTMEIKDAPWDSEDDGEGWESAKLKTTGLGIGFIRGIGLSKSQPIFLEVGANATYLFKKAEESHDEKEGSYSYSATYTDNYKFLNVAIPINGVYKIKLSDAISLSPFFGLNLKVNILGKDKYEYTSTSSYTYRGDTRTESHSGEGEIGFFTKETDDDGEEHGYYFGDAEKNKASRFQFGLNLGVGFNVNKFYLGWSFQPDLSAYATNTTENSKGNDVDYKVKTRSQVITVGFNF